MKQKVILISGCSRGLGKFFAEKLASKGYHVYAGVRKIDGVKSQQKIYQNSSLNLFPVKLDINNDDDCRQAVKKIILKEKRLDVLINNAAYALVGPTDSFTVQEYLDILNTDSVGAFRLIKEVIPPMRRQKTGRILNITSLNGVLSLPNFGLYSSAKFALEALGLALRYELKPNGIWVTNIEPGAIAQDNHKEVDKERKLPHVPAREKFWFIKMLMPMISKEKIAETIIKVIENPEPPAKILLGRDAQITTFLQRFLPQKVWDSLLSFVWKK